MFIETQSEELKQKYFKLLEILGSLSRLFSQSNEPYIVSRSSENVFCYALNATNNARADNTADALKDNWAFGIKTFLYSSGRSYQKVAEFDRLQNEYRDKTAEEIIEFISKCRNERIELIYNLYGIKNFIYHLQVRKQEKIEIYEEPLEYVDIKSIKNIVKNKNTISFQDKFNEYSFSLNKSTLSKRFITSHPIESIDVKILSNPFEWLLRITSGLDSANTYTTKSQPYVVLPLYSYRDKQVPEKSGLNQWNASGRTRHPNEIYIPLPSWIVNDRYKGFFPPRDTKFNLRLPDGKILSCKVCQDNNKALMSDPNKDLGEWLLRKVLKLKENELCTKSYLDHLGIDSVIVTKNSINDYSINFANSPSYSNFLSQNIIGGEE